MIGYLAIICVVVGLKIFIIAKKINSLVFFGVM